MVQRFAVRYNNGNPAHVHCIAVYASNDKVARRKAVKALTKQGICANILEIICA